MENRTRKQLQNWQDSVNLLEDTMAEFDREISAIQQMLNHATEILIIHQGKSPDEARAIAESAALNPPTENAKRSPGQGRGGGPGHRPSSEPDAVDER